MYNNDLQIAKIQVELHKPDVQKYSNLEEPLFQQIMQTLRGSITEAQTNELIRIYVEAIHAKFWEGWHSHAVATAEQTIRFHEEVSA